MRGLHENQRKILEYLQEHTEGSTLDDLSNHLQISKTATKEHLLRIDGLGLIHFEDRKGEVGRPRRFYYLSPEGLESFPRQYSWLSNSLLSFITKNYGSEHVKKLMIKLAHDVVESMKGEFKRAQSAKEKATRINEVMNDLGYRSTLKQRDIRKGIILEATNCVYHDVAQNIPELCYFDIEFIKQASGGMNVSLEKCITRGDGVCRFCIKKKD
ncbi:MAG: methanogen output domain 1-containing protein [Bdellovibrionota bacterium]